MKDVSIIIPAYNVEKYISDCIKSIINQSYIFFELIIIDDGSTDNTLSICQKFSKLDKRIILIHQNNLGVSQARNTGLRTANCEYICFVDGDDIIHKDFIKTLHEHILTSDVSMCLYKRFENAEEINTNNTLNQNETIILDSNNYWYYPFKYGNDVISCNKMFRKKIFAKIQYPPNTRLEDEYIIHELIEQCNQITLINDQLYFYRIRADSFTNTQALLQSKMIYISILLKRTQFYIDKNKPLIASTFFEKGLNMLCVCYYNKRNSSNFKPLIKKYRQLKIKNSKVLHISFGKLLFLKMPILYYILKKLY